MLVLEENVAGQSDRQLTGSSKIASPEVVRTVMQSEAQAGGRGRGWKLSETSTLHILRTMCSMVHRTVSGRDHTVLIQSCCMRADSVCSEHRPDTTSLSSIVQGVGVGVGQPSSTSPTLPAQTPPTVRDGSEN